jgi:predicted lipid-binding transport protein (Tim44 family)
MSFKFFGIAALAAGLALSLVPDVSEAKRLGGARSSGMQRTAPERPPQAPPAATPNQNAAAPAAAPAAAGTAAAAGSRGWMAPIAGLAAGLGLAALFSYLGLGAELANFVMIALLVLAAVVVVRLLMMRGRAGGAPQRPAMATSAGSAANFDNTMRRSEHSAAPGQPAPWVPAIGSGAGAATPGAAPAGPVVPPGFDVGGFERLAKLLFIRMQAANDRADLDDLRQFTTPELFAELRLDLQERGDAPQHTDVVRVDAELIDFAEEDARQIVSVRYTGLVREAEQPAGSEPVPFDEVWHLVKPTDDSGRGWAIAGIQQRA